MLTSVSTLTTFPMRPGELFSFNGLLAQYEGDRIGPDVPVRTMWLRVSRLNANEWPHLIGQKPWNAQGTWRTGQVNAMHGGRLSIDTEPWTVMELPIAIPEPRDGKTYTWRWSSASREWVRDYYDLCWDCRKSHAPGMSHCSWCGIALRAPAETCKACAERGH